MQSSSTNNFITYLFKKIIPVFIICGFSSSLSHAQYCTPAASNCNNGNTINNVIIGSLNNGSGCEANGYTDYSTNSFINVPELVRGGYYAISVIAGTGVQNVAVWIDGNHNGIFDTAEFIFSGTTTGGFFGQYAFIPLSLSSGITRMRVRVSDQPISNTDACTSYTLSETEDYSVNIEDCPIEFSSQPENSSVCATSSASFGVYAYNSFYGIDYQWQVSTDGGASYTDIADGGVYSGTNSNLLLLTGVPLSYNNYRYRAIASIPACASTAISNPAILGVAAGSATITAQPVGATLCQGSDYTFTVSTTGGPVGYQWQVSETGCYGIFTNIAAANSPSLTITNISGLQNHYAYRCVIAAGTCFLTTDCATLSVYFPPSVYTQPLDAGACPGENVFFIVYGSGASFYQWQVSAAGGAFTDLPGETNQVLMVNAVTTPMNGNQYRVVLSNPSCGQVISNAASLTVSSLPVITQQPVSVTVCENEYAQFFVVPYQPNFTYQWQVSTGGGPFVDLPGAIGDTLRIYPLSAALDGNQYQVVISGTGCSGSTVSLPATLTINPGVSITTQPSEAFVCEGADHTFTVAASGTGLSYQWQSAISCGYTYADIPGATAPSYTLTNVTNAQNYSGYRCIISGNCAPLISDCVGLNVISSPIVIYSQPADISVCSGQTAVFWVNAGGAGITYQWQVSTDGGTSFTDITDSTGNSLIIHNVTATLSGNQYQVIVNNGCGPALISSVATLTVINSAIITTQPSDISVCTGSPAYFAVFSNSPNIHYQWQLSTNGGPFVSIPGATQDTLHISTVTATLSGNQYQVLVNQDGCSGTTTSVPATLTVEDSLVINSQPVHILACEGTVVTFNVDATASNLSYQWQVSTDHGSSYIIIPGATNSSYVTGPITAAMDMNLYQVIINGSCQGLVAVAPDTLSVLMPLTITTQPANISACAGNNAYTCIDYSGSFASARWQVSVTGCSGNFTDIPGAIYSCLSLPNVLLSQTNSAYRCIITGTCNATTITTGCAILTVSDSIPIISQPLSENVCEGMDASFTIVAGGTGIGYQWQVGPDPFNFTDLPGETNATLILQSVTAALNNTFYRVMLSTPACPDVKISIPVLLTVGAGSAVTTSNPYSVPLCEGSLATFNAYASGNILGYQWELSTDLGATFTDIAGATDSFYIAGPVTAGMQNYLYQALITSGCGSSVIAGPDTLTISTPVIVSQPADITTCTGNNINFWFVTTGTVSSVQWQVSNTGCSGVFVDIPGEIYPYLTLFNVSNAQNNYAYRCMVTGACGSSIITDCAVLTVEDFSITVQPVDMRVCIGSDAVFSVNAGGSGISSYQWQVSEAGNPYTNISGATNSSLLLPSVTATHSGNRYRVMIFHAFCSSILSDSALLTVTSAPNTVIAANPSNTNLLPGQSTILTATVSPTGNYTFVWQKDGALLAGAGNGNSITVDAGNPGAYYVISSSDAGGCADTSNIIIVTDSASGGRYRIYANPNSGQFTIAYPNLPQGSSVTMFDSRGQRIHLKATVQLNRSIDIDMRPVVPGVYVIVVSDVAGKRLFNGKVIVE